MLGLGAREAIARIQQSVLGDRAEKSPRRHYILTVPVYDTYIQRGKPAGTSGVGPSAMYTSERALRVRNEKVHGGEKLRVWLKGAITGVSSECDARRGKSGYYGRLKRQARGGRRAVRYVRRGVGGRGAWVWVRSQKKKRSAGK